MFMHIVKGSELTRLKEDVAVLGKVVAEYTQRNVELERWVFELERSLFQKCSQLADTNAVLADCQAELVETDWLRGEVDRLKERELELEERVKRDGIRDFDCGELSASRGKPGEIALLEAS